MSKNLTRISQVVIDLTSLTLALCFAFLMRFDWAPPTEMWGRFFLVAPYVVIFEYLILYAFQVHRYSWRYVGLRETTRILGAAAVWSACFGGSRFLVGALQYQHPYLRHGVIPLGVVGVNFLLSYGAIVGVRVMRRLIGERQNAGRRLLPESGQRARTLLVGAGEAGFMVVREMRKRPDLDMEAVGFLDDDATKVGTVIHGVPVIGTTEGIAEHAASLEADQVLITMASAPGETVRRIRSSAEGAGLAVKIIPGLYEIMGGHVNLSRIRNIAIEDLLRRDPVELDADSITQYLADRVVVVTGAGGSIGSELVRQICGFKPRLLMLIERSENSLFEIHREVTRTHPDICTLPCIADVTDAARIDRLFAQHRPSAVFHAAAHKHVPMMEWNPAEAVKNNVFGSKVVADASHAHGADAFVMVSTDKAVNPTSIMGATKRLAELYVQSLAPRSSTRFVTVRFGNVLGSAGSVVPIFREQIARGGPVTVTHPEMRRYFMTIPEACQLVLQAGCIGSSGDIMVLDMGEPVRIVDLARDLISLSGLREGEDIVIEFSGVRPGEKLFEELATDGERAEKTSHPKIFVGHTSTRDVDRVRGSLEFLRQACDHPASLRARIMELVPEMIPAEPTGNPASGKLSGLVPVRATAP